MSLLQVKNLVVEFPGRRGTLRALDDISFDIAPGEILGVVGESGAGKSLTGASIIGLLEPPGRVAGGTISLDGSRIDNLPQEKMRRVRGKQIGARLAAEIGDGWTAFNLNFRANLPAYLESLAAAGKDRAAQRVSVTFQGGVFARPDEGDVLGPWCERPRETWQAWQEAGADEAILTAASEADIDRLVDATARW